MSRTLLTRAAAAAFILLATSPAGAQDAAPPDRAPVPDLREPAENTAPPTEELPEAAPLPGPSPEHPAPAPSPEEKAQPGPPDVTVPETAPLPSEPPAPAPPGEAPAEAEPPSPAPAPPAPPADPRSALRPDPSGKLPAEETACRARLAALGAVFETRPAEIDEANGCALPYPLSVSRLGPDTALQPPALMNCATAEAAARFLGDEIQPAARATFGQPVDSLANASAYVCRPRAGTRKLSEHAFGNALDIAAFGLADGRSIVVHATGDATADGFLARMRIAACGPFKTVLGPGSNADHADHLHLDLQPRRSGSTYCR